MTHVAEWMLMGILRASIGLSVAAVVVAASTRLLRLRAPRAEQWAWLLVLAQGLVWTPFCLPAPWLRSESANEPEPMSRVAAAWTGSPDAPLAEVSETEVGSERDAIEPPRSPTVTSLPMPIDDREATVRRVPLWPVVGLVCWLIGLSFCLVLGATRYLAFLKRTQAFGPAPAEWQAAWQRLLQQRGVRKPIPLLVSEDIGPALYRSLHGYCIVVPIGPWSELSPTEQAAVFRHELAHFERGDLWRSLAARLLAAVHWFNPLAWWASRHVDEQAEFACDQMAAEERGIDFAAALARIAIQRRRASLLVQPVSAGSIIERTKRLLAPLPRQSSWKCAMPIIAAVVALAVGGVRLQALAEDKDDAGALKPAASFLPTGALVRIGTDDLRTENWIAAIAFSPNGRYVAAAPNNCPAPEVLVFDAKLGLCTRTLKDSEGGRGWVNCLAFSPNGAKVLGGTMTGEVILWDLLTGVTEFRGKLHNGQVADAKFSPDGQFFASSGREGKVQFRKSANPGKPFKDIAIAAEPAAPRDVEMGATGAHYFDFAPDNTRIVVGSATTGDISTWRVADGKRLHVIARAHGAGRSMNPPLNCIAVTPDGRYILSSGQHTVPRETTSIKYGSREVTLTEVRLWNLETGERVRELQGKEDYGFGYAGLSPDGSKVAIADFGRLTIRETETGTIVRTIEMPGSWGRRPVFSPDGNIVAMPLENAVAMFDVASGQRLHHDDATPTGDLRSTAWSNNGKRIATENADGFIRVWNAGSGELIWTQELAPVISPSGWKAAAYFITFSPDDNRVIVAGRRDDPVEYKNGIVAILDGETGKVLQPVYLKEIRGAALSPDGKTVVVATNHGGLGETRLHGIDIATGEIRYTMPPEKVKVAIWSVEAMAFRKDSQVVVASGNGEVTTFDSMSGKELGQFVAEWRTPEQIKAKRPSRPDIWEAAISADSTTLVTSAESNVYVWDLETGKLRRTIEHPHKKGCKVALSPDAKMLATADLKYAGDYGENTIRLYDLVTGDTLTLEPDDNRAGVLKFSPDGTKLFTGFHRGSAIVWDVRRP
jgi:WD40 repeat protein/beta-lactamase regulating signal transducer with metallopeptidase domain